MVKNMISSLFGILLMGSIGFASETPAEYVYCGRVEMQIFDLGAPLNALVLTYPYGEFSSSAVLFGDTPQLDAELANFDVQSIGANLMFCAYSKTPRREWAYGGLIKVQSYELRPWMPY